MTPFPRDPACPAPEPGGGAVRYVTDARGVRWPAICICGGEVGRFCPECNLDLTLIEPEPAPRCTSCGDQVELVYAEQGRTRCWPCWYYDLPGDPDGGHAGCHHPPDSRAGLLSCASARRNHAELYRLGLITTT